MATKTKPFTLLSGETIDVPLHTGELGVFLERLFAAVDDPTIDEATFLSWIYSAENPLLDKTIMPGRGTVTKAVFADPTYHLMVDLLGRKRVALGSLDMDKVRARYSMTVKDAAAKLGVHENAIRQAIAAKRLSSVKVKNEHRLDPAQVNAFEIAARGPSAPLHVAVGATPTARLKIKSDGRFVEESSEGQIHRGRLDGWTVADVIASSGEKARHWRIAKGNEVTEIGLPPFVVRGRFTIVEKTNNPRRARAAFKASELHGTNEEQS